jgi:hypothetical protein
MKKMAAMGTLLLLLTGCGDTWNKFMTPDFSWSHDRAVSADRTPARAVDTRAPLAPMAQPTPSLIPRTAAPASRAAARTAAKAGCYRGQLTAEGNTCQAMRTDGGDLLTLAGPLRGFGAGDTVCVCGIPSAQQFCGQGTTLLIREIDTDCAGIQ